MSDREKFLKRIKALVLSKEPNAKIYLYGSRARGNYNELSDWDLLILLNKENITLEIENQISNPLYDLEFETGQIISPMIYSEKEWNSKYSVTSYFHNAMKEGMLL